MGFEFWRKVRKWSHRKEKAAFTESRGLNLKCKHCNTWWSAADEGSKLEECGHPIAVRYICGQCRRPSHWVCEAGFWFDAERFGVNLPEDEAKP